MTSITITADDLAEVAERLLPFCSTDPTRPILNHLIVEATDVGLRWTGTDSYRLGSLARGSADIEGPVLVPRSLVDFATRAATRMGVETVEFEVHLDTAEIVLSLPSLRVPRPLLDAEIPDIDHFLDLVPERAPAVLTVAAESLRGAVHACISFADDEFDGSKPVALRSVDGHSLLVAATWAGSSDAIAFLPAEAEGDVDTLVNSAYLLSLLDAIPDQELTLFIGDPTDPLRIRTTDGFHGLLMPLRVGQSDLERVMAEFLGLDHDDLIVDDDGGVPVRMGEVSLRATLLRDTDPFGRGDLVRFVAVAAEGLDPSLELFREINEVNVAARLTRVLLIEDTVYVAAENLLATLDVEEVDAVCAEVARQARRIGPLLEAVHR